MRSLISYISCFARPKRTPTILQMEAVECGAASLAMIMASHGLWVPMEELRIACGVTRDGSKASNVLKAARSYGFSAKGFKKEPEDLTSLPTPSIIHWNFNHYVVFEGFKDAKAYLNDPGSGPRVVSQEEFDQSYTGVVLAFEPSPDLRRRGRAPSILASMRSRLENSRAALFYVLAVSLLLVVPGIAIAGFSRIFVDEILVAGKEDWLVPLVLGVLTAALLRGGMTWLQQKYLLRMETRLSLTMASTFLWHMIRLPMSFFQQRHVGDLSDRMAANDRVARLLSGDLATNSLNLSSVVFYGAAIAVFDGTLAVIAFGLALMNVVALRIVNRSREDNSRALLADGGKLAATTVAAIRSIETLKSSGMEDDTFAKWAGYQAKMLEQQRNLGFSTAVLTAFPALMSSLTAAAILGVGGFRVMDGALSVGAIVAIQSLMANLTAPISGLVDLGGKLQRIKGDLTRLDDIRSAQPDDTRIDGAEETWAGPPVLSGRVEARNLSFGFSPLDPPMIDGISISVEAGSRIAIVGASGSGKSTLGRLIAGVLKPWDGDVLIDGHPLAEVPRQVFADTVAYVDQDIFLFSGTIHENLTLWDGQVPDHVLTQALKDSAIHDDVMARPGRIESLVEEGGINFSGGQRQRLELARALVGQPRVLVLDEATAALDPVTEKNIDDNLRRRGCTCIIIAHRLSTIRDCDEIIVLRKGKIAERGTHEHLMAHGQEYPRLIGTEGVQDAASHP
ncbi:MAG: NHLP family bacteriocin export ABC transporter peptidase/permease/ATPase subunit [Rhodospirillales bacterium]